MAQFKLESIRDDETGRYYVEVYREGEDVPLVVGKPIYMSHEHAMADAVEMFKTAMPGRPIIAWTE